MNSPTIPGNVGGAVERFEEIEKKHGADSFTVVKVGALDDAKFLLRAYKVMRQLALDAYPKREHVRADGASVDAEFEAAMREPEE